MASERRTEKLKAALDAARELKEELKLSVGELKDGVGGLKAALEERAQSLKTREELATKEDEALRRRSLTLHEEAQSLRLKATALDEKEEQIAAKDAQLKAREEELERKTEYDRDWAFLEQMETRTLALKRSVEAEKSCLAKEKIVFEEEKVKAAKGSTGTQSTSRSFPGQKRKGAPPGQGHGGQGTFGGPPAKRNLGKRPEKAGDDVGYHNPDANIKCKNCGMFGHKWRRCPDEQGKGSDKSD